MFDSQREQTAPPSGKRNEAEAAVGDRKPVAVGWAEQSRVKVERERSERTLRRFCGANRWGRREVEAGRDRQGEPGERSEPGAGLGKSPARREKNGGRRLFQRRGCRRFRPGTGLVG